MMRTWVSLLSVAVASLWLQVSLPVYAAESAALNPALTPPFPRAVNYGWVTDGTQEADLSELEPYAGAVIDASTAGAGGDLFKSVFGASKALFAAVEWQGKDPLEATAGNTGPALDSIFPGHFLYYQGATVDDLVFDDAASTRVHVSAVSLFEVGDAVTLAPIRVSTGATIFDPAGVEVVVVAAIEPDTVGLGGTLIVERAQFGTTAKGYVALAARAFPHAEPAHAPLWRWNLALDGAIGPQSQRGYNAVADWLSNWVLVAHPSWDGLLLPHARWQLDAGAFGNRGAHNRAADTNADGVADWGYLDGANQFGMGELAMTNNWRTDVGGDRALLIGFQPSGTNPASPWPGPGGASGAWLERFPDGDLGGNFDSAFARLTYWSKSAPAGVEPVSIVYTQANTAAYGGGGTAPQGNAVFRLGLAAACLTDAWHTYTTAVGQQPFTNAVYAWDEYVGGEENRPGWLGYPLEPAQRHTEKLGGLATQFPIGRIGWTIVVNTQGAAADDPFPEPDSTAIRVDITGVAAPLPAPGDLALLSPTFTVPQAGQVTIHFRAMASFSDSPAPPSRDVGVRLKGTLGENLFAGVVPVGTQWRDYYLTLPLSGALTGRMTFELGGPLGSFWVDQPEIRQGNGDGFTRRFQGGLVLLNGGDTGLTFTLPATYRRLSGSVDPIANDGATGLTQETVPARDARFLLVDEAGPTPTAIPTVSPTPTPSPTPSPSPTTTPLPTVSPTPTSTPLPTMTPIGWPTLDQLVGVILGKGSYPPATMEFMDQNGDGSIDSADVTRYLAP